MLKAVPTDKTLQGRPINNEPARVQAGHRLNTKLSKPVELSTRMETSQFNNSNTDRCNRQERLAVDHQARE